MLTQQELTATKWHSLPIEQALDELDSSPEGLTASEALRRRAEFGDNRLPVASGPGVMRRFLQHFHNILIYVLLGAAGITAVLGHWMDTSVILAVVVVNAMIGFLQEGKAEKAMDTLRQMLSPTAHVLRDGERVTLPASQLVPGDIVLVGAGDKIPADLRLLDSTGLRVQEAVLTGESVAVEKQLEPVASDMALADRTCMAFSSTLVVSGQGRGIVVATGTATEVGKISDLLARVQPLITPFVAQMAVFARWLTGTILLLAALLLVYGYWSGYQDLAGLFMLVVGLSVAAIPEGLPAVLTITLAVGVQAMAKRAAIVRRLPAIETLGSMSVICSDKTGTLTRNEMMVTSLRTADYGFSVDGEGYAPSGALRLDGNEVSPSEYPSLAELARTVSLCNDADLQHKDGQWRIHGDPMEGALLTLAGKLGADPRGLQSQWLRLDAIPFDASYRFMASLNQGQDDSRWVFIKGAPEVLLARCVAQRTQDGQSAPLDTEFWHRQSEQIAAKGQRLLAVAVKPMAQQQSELSQADLADELILLGLVGLIDPPRHEAIAAVAECLQAGIGVKMITGDHALTAAAIGEQIGLAHPHKVLTGVELDALDDTALQQVVLECDIFARTSPEHKLRLVSALQAQGNTVAMTGDGVNDAPALKRADAGIAMGQKGSEAAKEAADLVLADDNFASILAAVREGRTVYDNLKKVISWTLPTNAGEAMTIILALFLGMTLPVTPVQILWVNLITAITLGLALAFEPTEPRTMLRPPRAPNKPLLSGELVWQILLVALLFSAGVYGLFDHAMTRGAPVELARTLALNTLVVMEIFHLFFIRNLYGNTFAWRSIRGTSVIWTVVILVTLAQFAITYWPPLQQVFATQAVSWADGVKVVAVAATVFVITVTEKTLRRSLYRYWQRRG